MIGRGRVYPDPRALSLLRRLRGEIPASVRAASARGLEYATPPAPLVRLFALDEIRVALPVLRNARLTSTEWVQLLPELAPAARAVLRNRRDLSPMVRRALETYGPIDFVLPDESVKEIEEVAVEEIVEVPSDDVMPVALPEPEPVVEEVPAEVAIADEIAVEEAPVAEAPEPEQLIDWTDVIAARPAEPASVPAPVVATPLVEIPVEAEPEPVAEVEETVEETVEPAEIESALDIAEITAPEPVQAPVQSVDALLARLESVLPPVEEAPVSVVPEQVAVEEDLSFVALAGVAASLAAPAIVAAIPATMESVPIQSGTVEAETPEQPIAEAAEPAQEPAMASADTLEPEAPLAAIPEQIQEFADLDGEEQVEGPFQISEVVARLDSFWKDREEGTETRPARPMAPAQQFRFETDAKGVVRWVDGVSRAPIVGLSLDLQATPAGGSSVDGVAAGAFRRRAGFSNARMAIEGESDASGDWLISAIPVFDPANGRFTGYRGTARRPRIDERADPIRMVPPATPADSLRQLVHELRTPTNAIAGFAEMIETQMLGPVSDPYRERAGVIRGQARELLGAIDDLDLAARIDSAALSLVPAPIKLRPVLAGIADDLAQLAALRGSGIALPIDDLSVTGDRRAVERLLARLMATLVSASGPGERIGVRMALDADEVVAITLDRPKALSDYPGDSVLGIDDEAGDATLLGTGFALRLARNLSRELGGSLVIEPESLTLRLPASVNTQVGQAHLS
ncbi:histidine kinase dimerization/phospho-acceptor domain-containing protein [Sphingomonas sp. AOB5]|uniref:sensor histidine kinase n=1 Tax=Sphingomonas sp. AOB5 TaxID=3034017 RepID=UPI0023F901A4|nr:histidine kinase dimerization/phospho-acceptor domain-containing protein [Sphingomonas sp. AOB5]MDF7774499.1 histidine kinase dimerization/phospho-acceptor domain-containing protein [Sphingomonas sp. AOB5]